MAGWDAKGYDRFEAERNRPSIDLIARIPEAVRRRVVDLGCGSGVSTQALRSRFPLAQLAGVDNSASMLDAARKRLPDVEFTRADVAQWRDEVADLVFANAVFHWVPGHIAILARIAGDLPPYGCLAVQMPDNENEATHALMREVASRPAFRDKLARAGEGRDAIGAFADYDAALSPACDFVDIWRTTYVHRLASPEAIVAWVEGAGLRPYLAPLDADERANYLESYREEITRAYPRRAFGGVLLPFPRLFVVAARTGQGG